MPESESAMLLEAMVASRSAWGVGHLMGLSYGQIKRWNAADAELLAEAMSQRVRSFERIEEDLRDSARWGDSWSGSHGERAASRSITALGDEVTDLAAEATAIRRLASHVADGVSAIRQLILNTEEYAAKYSFSVSDDGRVLDLAPGLSGTEDQEALREAARIDLEQSVFEIVAKGRYIEQEAADGLARVNAGDVHDGGATSIDQAVRSQMGVVDPPPAGTDPHHVNIWWESLSDAEQDQVTRLRGDEIRNLPGIDTDTRDLLNRTHLAMSHAPAEATAAQARARYDAFLEENRWEQRRHLEVAPGDAGLRAERDALQAEVDSAERRVVELARLDEALVAEDSHLIEFDDTTPQLQAIYAVGNPDTADNVAITTPGYTTNVHDSIEGMSFEAEYLQETAQMIDPDATTSAIAFLGYQAPQDVLTNDDLRVATPAAAAEGAALLEQSVRGVAATNGNPDLNLSLFGHSYGSTTAGIAAQELAEDAVTPVDRLVVYGSPGVPETQPRYDTSEVVELITSPAPVLHNPNQNADLDSMGLDPSRAYYMANDGDVVSGAIGEIGQRTRLGLGTSPENWGMTELSTDTGDVTYPDGTVEERYDTEGHIAEMRKSDPGYDVGVHSSFPKELTTSQFNLAAIAAGRPDLAVR